MKELGQVLLYLIAGTCAFLWIVKVPILSHYATEELRAPVVFEWVSFLPSEIKMRGFRIEGPSEDRSAFLLKAKEVTCQGSWFSNPIVIEDLSLHSVTINIAPLSTEPSQTNWDVLEGEIPEPLSGTSVIVQKCVFTNITVIERDGDGKHVYREIDRLEFQGLRDEKGFPTKQILERIQAQ